VPEIVERVLQSSRYRDVDPSLLTRLADEELPRARNADDAVKRVKRRLHQAVGAFRGTAPADALAKIRHAWHGDVTEPAFRAACADVLATHASMRERVPFLDRFYAAIWERTGPPARVLDIGCGLGPLALPWMEIGPARYVATDVDQRPLVTARAFLELVGQAHEVVVADAVTNPPLTDVDVALLLKLVPTLDRQDAHAAARLLDTLRAGHAVVSFPARSLAGRGKGMERTYRQRLDRLVAETGRVREVTETSVPNELVFVLTLEPMHG
jgi:16S rRNA (guanine(1405)-N(7))-methyltransferase